MSIDNKPGPQPVEEKHVKPLSFVNACIKGLRQFIGLAFLVWSVFAGGALLRWQIFGNRNGWAYDLAQAILGCFVAVLLWFTWQRIARDDRDYIVGTLAKWALAIAVALTIKIYWP